MPCNSRQLRVAIPARYGSQRLPGKPLVDLAGKPMIVRVFDAVSAALDGHEVVVAVDDDLVMEVLRDYGIAGVMTDPEYGSGTDRVAAVARERSWQPHDVVLNVQGDEPLVPADMLAAFADFSVSCAELSMATISVPMQGTREVMDPNVVKLTTRDDGTAISFSRAPIPFDRDQVPERWDPANYRRHLGVYAYRNDVLQRLTATPPCALEQIEKLEQLRALWLGVPIRVMDWAVSPPGGVDTAEDVMRVTTHLNGL